MRNLILLLFTVILTMSFLPVTSAQFSEREVGLNTSNLTSLGLDYKRKTGENKYLRLWASYGNFSLMTSLDKSKYFNYDLDIGIGLGFERRKYLGENTFCFHGFAPFLGFTLEPPSYDRSMIKLNLGLSYVLGIAYDIADKFYFAVEINPGISVIYDSGIHDNIQSVSVGGNFDQDFVSLSINYRFNKSEN